MLGVIGGSRAYDLLCGLGVERGALRPVPTPFGPSSPLAAGRLGSTELVVVSRHGAAGYELAAASVNYRANLYALRDRGVRLVVAWSGPGAVDPSLQVGQYVVPDDLLDETQGRAGTFFAGTGLGLLRQSPVFCPALAATLGRALGAAGAPARLGGTYVCTQGPRLETPAEVRRFAGWGAHLVGMTLCPEVFLARELEMCYAALCYVTNYAEGVVPHRPPRPERLFGGLATEKELAAQEAAARRLPEIVERLLAELPVEPQVCTCGQAMHRYREQGLIGEDWREWVTSE